MLDFLNTIGYNNLVNILICIISLVGGYFANTLVKSKPTEREILQKRLDFVYTPLFQKFEPYLYQKLTNTTAKELITCFDKIKAKYYLLIDSDTLLEFSTFKDNFSKDRISYKNFCKLCYSIDKNFEKLRKTLGYPTRSFAYKWSNHQYPDSIQLKIERIIRCFFIFSLLIIVVLFISSIVFLISSSISLFIMKIT